VSQPSFLFRVDASLAIGSGHVMRCLTLADSLRTHGADCRFVSVESEGHLCDVVEARGFPVHRMASRNGRVAGYPTDTRSTYSSWLGVSEEEDARQIRDLLLVNPVDWIVLDHYALGAIWQREIRPWCRRLFVIDDLADRAHDCDALLDQNLGRAKTDYDSLVPADCQRLIGPGYALLRSEFALFRAESLRRRSDGRCRSIIVTMGGVDRHNVTGSVLQALDRADLEADIMVTAVLGGTAPWKDAVLAQADGMSVRTEVIVNATNMAQLMRDADLAIGAAGSTSWERCCMGLPTLQVTLEDNQKLIAEALNGQGAAVSFDRDSIPETVGHACSRISRDPERLAAMSASAASVTDGLGAARVTTALLSGDQP